MIRGMHAQGRGVILYVCRSADKTCTVAIKVAQYKCILNGMLIFVELPSVTFFWRCIQHFSSCYMCTAGQSNCNRCCATVQVCLKIRISGKGCSGLESSEDKKLGGRWRTWKGTVREEALKESKTQSGVKWKLAKSRIQWKHFGCPVLFQGLTGRWLWWCWNKIYVCCNMYLLPNYVCTLFSLKLHVYCFWGYLVAITCLPFWLFRY